ncbi:unnamed protein product [Symbiodinium natans]|uniref:Uncharacterized protein n=1 Tax=Symbiodinium natans TaxID=878477 RepID=A0A812KIM9_9DINO|nr:unnamed protein product [Symbiodinium natans]
MRGRTGAKLFDEEMQVLHTTTEGKFSGGALVKEIIVRAKHLEGSSNLNLNVYYPGTSEEVLGTTTVGYIDSLASEPKTGGGRAMWDFISGMNFICIACHSILLQKTVDFWQARGMQHMDPSSEKDCNAFRQLVMVHTMGKGDVLLLMSLDVVRLLRVSKPKASNKMYTVH